MKKAVLIILFLMSSSFGTAQAQQRVPESIEQSAEQVPSYVGFPSDAADVFIIYPGNGVPPASEEWTWQEKSMPAPFTEDSSEMVRNVAIPTLTMFKPEANKANGTAVIIAPGGAFHFLMMNHEGYDVARRLTEHGITSFVLKYRVQHTPEENAEMPEYLEELFAKLPQVSQSDIDPPMSYPPAEEARLWAEEDGRQAIRFLRSHAADLNIEPDRIGIMGFSAGGGVTVNAALEFDALTRPDFAGGIYPGYRTVETIPENLPPLFIAIADDDNLVAPMSSARLYETWHKAGASAELHIFAAGGHGFGLREQGLPSDNWINLFLSWIDNKGYLSGSN